MQIVNNAFSTQSIAQNYPWGANEWCGRSISKSNYFFNWHWLVCIGLNFLEKGYLEDDVSKEERKCIMLKCWLYTLQNIILYKLGLDAHQCLNPFEAQQIMTKMHERLVWRHYDI